MKDAGDVPGGAAVQRRRMARRIAVKEPLKRVAEGEFGYCVECGEPIAIGRLDLETCVRRLHPLRAMADADLCAAKRDCNDRVA